jgi:hypothetical protein
VACDCVVWQVVLVACDCVVWKVVLVACDSVLFGKWFLWCMTLCLASVSQCLDGPLSAGP